jgi:hypothetical protein
MGYRKLAPNGVLRSVGRLSRLAVESVETYRFEHYRLLFRFRPECPSRIELPEESIPNLAEKPFGFGLWATPTPVPPRGASPVCDSEDCLTEHRKVSCAIQAG